MKRYPLAIILTAATLSLASCSKEDVAQGGGQRELAVDVRMDDSEWTTRAGGSDGRTVSPAIALDDQLEIVAETMPTSAAEAPVTRGVPVASASKLPSMGLAIYTNSAFTKNASATNNGGSWALAGNIALDLDKNSYSYYAFAPAASTDAGITLASNGQTLTYVAPADVTLQPDLCWATPVTNDKTGTPTFAMRHAMTAVGLRVRADNVEIESVKLLQVNTSGTLNVTNGTWSSLGTLKDQTFPLLNTKPSTGDNIKDLSGTNGYLMLPPQSISADTKKLVIRYRYTGETDWRTGTHTLNALNGGVAWAAGQKVTYTLQLKAKFSLTLSPTSASVPIAAGSYTFNYTTSSSAPLKDPTAVATGDWITGLTVNRKADGTGTISFNYKANTTVARKSIITVTSGFTEQKFEFTQLVDNWITLSSNNPGGDIERWGGEYSLTVSTPAGVGWTVTSNTTSCTITPSSGSGTADVKISVPAHAAKPNIDPREVKIVFATSAAGLTPVEKEWKGTQYYIPNGYYSSPVSGGNVYVSIATFTDVDVIGLITQCSPIKGRIPTKSEMGAIRSRASTYQIAPGLYWDSYSRWDSIWHVIQCPSGTDKDVSMYEKHSGRCVRTYP